MTPIRMKCPPESVMGACPGGVGGHVRGRGGGGGAATGHRTQKRNSPAWSKNGRLKAHHTDICLHIGTGHSPVFAAHTRASAHRGVTPVCIRASYPVSWDGRSRKSCTLTIYRALSGNTNVFLVSASPRPLLRSDAKTRNPGP